MNTRDWGRDKLSYMVPYGATSATDLDIYGMHSTPPTTHTMTHDDPAQGSMLLIVIVWIDHDRDTKCGAPRFLEEAGWIYEAKRKGNVPEMRNANKMPQRCSKGPADLGVLSVRRNTYVTARVSNGQSGRAAYRPRKPAGTSLNGMTETLRPWLTVKFRSVTPAAGRNAAS